MSFLLLFASLGFAFADLQFDETELVFHPTINDTESTGLFRFVNVANTPITIKEVKTSCGCTTAGLAKRTYLPGEEGVIMATFRFEERQGRKSKRIFVTTDASSEPIQLTVTAHIPEVLKIRPTMVWWKRGEEATAKTVTVHVRADQPANLMQISFSAEGFDSSVKTIKPGREYQITVTPRQTEKPVVASMSIQTDLPRRGTFRSYAMIR
jgi:hypothetical protein